MLKKYFPFIILIAAGLLFFWVKKNQRGPTRKYDTTRPSGTIQGEPFNRNTHTIIYSKHAKCRMECRHIDDVEIKEILAKGEINYDKIEENEKGKTYPLEGITHEGQHVRLVIAPHEKELVVVTVIDLDKEWQCNCN